MKASGRFALIVATTVWMWGWGVPPVTADAAPGSQTASNDKTAVGKPLSLKKPAKPHHAAKHAPAARHAAKPKSTALSKGGSNADALTNVTADAEDGAPLPAKVANAHAEMPAAAADMPSALLAQAEAARQDAAKATAAPAAAVVAPDQINDVDLAANVEQAPAPGVATTIGKSAEPAPQQTATQASNDDSLWGNTSLIGKIFIAFGGLLTVASAARMFIA
ncbi:hypothetical protein [Rhodopseudomonas palustris]|uniref:Uncharacterized protein n=1 Tax=Rhodopseudomonas palustris (strain BisB18) TaxID=316056 RepID=Q217Y8_RHOPB